MGALNCPFFRWAANAVTNLVPSTAAANYNTLELVEQFIATKFEECKITQVQIDVKPTYPGYSLIPNQLDFELTWDEGGKTHKDVITIKPDSFARIGAQTHKAIDCLRNADELVANTSPTI